MKAMYKGKKCSVDDCERKPKALGLCQMHYTRFRVTGTTDKRIVKGGWKWKSDDIRYVRNKSTPCSVMDCVGLFYAKGFCKKHYNRYRETGSPIKKIKPPAARCSVPGCNDKVSSKGLCRFHYSRMTFGIPLDRPRGNRGSLNVNWKGGVSEYPNHSLLKRNRKIVLATASYICEYCGGKATQVHHRDHTKTNHDVSNLAPTCRSCNLLLANKPRKPYTSKLKRLYGMSVKEMASLLGLSCQKIRMLHIAGTLGGMITTPVIDYQI